jgi:uncharacterized membrane protein
MTDPRTGVAAGPSAALRNVEEIAKLERENQKEASLGARISLAITNRAGTFAFAVVHVLLLTAWMCWNTLAPPALQFDPYPFGLLTMIVSMEGVLLAVLVLITQNRMSRQTDRRDHLDLQVNLLAEQEMTMVLRMLSRIHDRLSISSDDEERDETQRLMEHTNIYELMEELRRKI